MTAQDRVTVLVSVPHGGAAGNMLRTGMVRRLLDSDPDLQVVLVSPMSRDPEFVREHGHPRVQFEDLPPHRPAGLEARLLALMQAAYLESGITASVRIRRAEALAQGLVRWLGAKRLVARVVAPSLVRQESRYDLSDRLVSHEWAETLFARFRPAMVVVSNPGLILSEVPLLRTAKRHRVRSIAVDPSWDNFTNKLIPVRRVDRLIVWNGLMKEQATALHGYGEEDVRVAGTPQWDVYFREAGSVSRETFLRRIGADPARKLVTLTTTPRELYRHYEDVIRLLMRAVEENRWSQPVQVLVRVHPRDELERYAPFAGTPHLLVEKPYRATARAGDGMAVDITDQTQRHLADTMQHSDVVVQVASTIAIESCLLDTPVVNIAFDGTSHAEFFQSARRYLQFTHFAHVTRHGGVGLADTPAAMVDHIGRYLDDPARDREGRRRVVQEQCQFTDGRSAERVGSFVIEELADVARRRAVEASACAGLQASSL